MTLEKAQADLAASGVTLKFVNKRWYAVRGSIPVAGPFPTWEWAYAELRRKTPW